MKNRFAFAATLLVRSVQDLGVGDLLQDLLTNKYGSEIYRTTVDEEFIGKTFLDFNVAMLGLRRTVLSLVREGDRLRAGATLRNTAAVFGTG